jgi:hypothetical protein
VARSLRERSDPRVTARICTYNLSMNMPFPYHKAQGSQYHRFAPLNFKTQTQLPAITTRRNIGHSPHARLSQCKARPVKQTMRRTSLRHATWYASTALLSNLHQKDLEKLDPPLTMRRAWTRSMGSALPRLSSSQRVNALRWRRCGVDTSYLRSLPYLHVFALPPHHRR